MVSQVEKGGLECEPRVLVWVNIEKSLVMKLLVKVDQYPVRELIFTYHNLPSKFCAHCHRFGHKSSQCAILQHRPLEDIYDISMHSPRPADDSFWLDDTPIQIWNPQDNTNAHGTMEPLEPFLDIPGNRESLCELFGENHPTSGHLTTPTARVGHNYEILGPVTYDEEMSEATTSILGKRTYPFNMPENYIHINGCSSESRGSGNSETRRVLDSLTHLGTTENLGADSIPVLPIHPDLGLELEPLSVNRRLSFSSPPFGDV